MNNVFLCNCLVIPMRTIMYLAREQYYTGDRRVGLYFRTVLWWSHDDAVVFWECNTNDINTELHDFERLVE